MVQSTPLSKYRETEGIKDYSGYNKSEFRRFDPATDNPDEAINVTTSPASINYAWMDQAYIKNWNAAEYQEDDGFRVLTKPSTGGTVISTEGNPGISKSGGNTTYSFAIGGGMISGTGLPDDRLTTHIAFAGYKARGWVLRRSNNGGALGFVRDDGGVDLVRDDSGHYCYCCLAAPTLFAEPPQLDIQTVNSDGSANPVMTFMGDSGYWVFSPNAGGGTGSVTIRDKVSETTEHKVLVPAVLHQASLNPERKTQYIYVPSSAATDRKAFLVRQSAAPNAYALDYLDSDEEQEGSNEEN